MSEGLRLDRVRIGKGSEELLAIDALVAPGEVLTVMGPSGSGKSTLLSFVIGNLAPAFHAEGRVLLGARDITDVPTDRRRIGILFQDDLLFPHLSVAGNLGFGLRGMSRAGRRERISRALDEMGLAGYEDRDPATLSGGQKARVSLMRMLLSEPAALLLDEPFSRLDAERRERIRAMVFERAREHDLPVVLVTHDARDADAAGGTVIHLGRTGAAFDSNSSEDTLIPPPVLKPS